MSDLGSTTLRLTLAMRGGVSLAVWIGGAVAEIDVLRRASLTPNPVDPRMRRYRELLAAAGYGKVEVDILAGASAGGFNAVLYGLAQSYGASVEPTRDLWANTGGIWQMLRPVGIRPLESFLQGDDYFLPTARMSLSHLTSKPGDPTDYVAENIDVELAATRIDDGSASAWGSRAAFSFVRTAASLESGFSTIPGAGQDPSDPVVSRAIDRLALAARATSSFPAAFEPATISSIATADDTGVRPNMSAVFPFARAADRPVDFDVIDGGVLDNIPVDRAIRAISRAAASSVTERRLFYLDPEPPREPLPLSPVKKFVIHSAVTVISYATALRKRTENVQDELPALREYNERGHRARARSAALAALLERRPGEPPRVPGDDEYARFRIDVDAERLAALLSEPARFVSHAPGFSEPFGRVSESATLPIRERLEKLYLAEPALVDGDVRAVRDLASFLIAWIRELEAALPAGDATKSLGRIKFALYRVLTVTFDARRRTVDLVFARGLDMFGATQDELPDIESIARASARAGAVLPELPPDVDAAMFPVSSGTVGDEAFYAGLALWSTLPAGSEGAVLGRLWEALDSARSAVYDLSDPFMAEADSTWRRTVFAQLYSSSWRETPIAHLFTAFAATGDVPGTSSVVKYHEVRADQYTPLAYGFWLTTPVDADIDSQVQGLIDASMGTWVSRWIHDPSLPVTLRTREKALTTDAKLAGNVVARFGGFLNAGWRVNDWKWGRMDAAAGIVDALGIDPRERGDAIAELQNQILADAAAVVERPGVVGDPTLAVGAEGARDLVPAYRFALVTRLAVLAPRVLWPSGSSVTSPKGFLGRVGALALRPFLPPLVMAADAVRAALAAAAVVLAAQVVGVHTISVGPAWQRAVLLGSVLFLAVTVWRWRSAITRWNRVQQSVHGADETEDKTRHLWIAYIDSQRSQHLRLIGSAMTVVVIGCIAALVALVRVSAPAAVGAETTVVVAVVLAVAVAVVDARTLDVRLTRRRFHLRRIIAASVAITLVVIASILALVGAEAADSVGLRALSSAALVGVLSGLSLWGWSARVHAAAWIIGLAVLAGGSMILWHPGQSTVVPFALLVWILGVSTAYLFVPARDRIGGDGLSPDRQ